MRRITTLVAALAIVAALGVGASTALAADAPSTPSVVDAVAARLGITTDQLRTAFKEALTARVDAAVAAGKLTPEQAAKLKQRIADGKGLGLGARKAFDRKAKELRHRLVARGKTLGAAAAYLGLSQKELRANLRSGKTLAQIAAATPGRSADGLVAAMTKAAKDRIAKAVADGKLTSARADELIEKVTDRIQKLVQAS